MSISKEEIVKEKKKLQDVLESLDKEIEESSSDLFLKEEELINFRKLNYEDKSSFDSAEFNQIMTADSLEALRVLSKRKYYKSLINIKDKPYFASFLYKDNEGNTYDIYMALTYLKDENYDNILYDWRSPNLDDHNLIVQGIAGSGKTSVALHRIAFLLYRIKNLSSNNVLIFSPNKIFSEYISNVLPELGEANTLETTFSDYLSYFLKEYKNIESFPSFIGKYYKGEKYDVEIIRYKQSKEIIRDLDNYINAFLKNFKVINDIELDKINEVSKEELNYLIKDKYSRFPLVERIDEASKYLSLKYYGSPLKRKSTIRKLIKDNINVSLNIKDIYKDFFNSSYAKYKLDIKNTKVIDYDDALLVSYLKGKLFGFPYNNYIKQVVIDEAQDYNYLQYVIIKEMFKKADFTILGDVNQNINPYYKYETLEELKEIFNDSNYLELLKTYRSTKEIIEYTNKILNLDYVNAIKKSNNKDVIIRKPKDIKESLLLDINTLTNTYKSLAIITKEDREAEVIYDLLKDDLNISLLTEESKSFIKDLVVVPSYIAKGLEFDSVIIVDSDESFKKNKYLYYVACTRAREELIIYE